MEEVFVKCIDSPLYEVSQLGNIRRVGKQNLKGCVSKKGFPIVWIRTPFRSNNVSRAKLVIRAFHPEVPTNNWVIGYRDGNKLNCRYENLFYRKVSEKVKKTWDEGKYKKRRFINYFSSGLRNPNSRIARKKGYWILNGKKRVLKTWKISERQVSSGKTIGPRKNLFFL